MKNRRTISPPVFGKEEIFMVLPKRKNVRLHGFDYNTPGYYFITICTKDKQKLLGEIVGTGLLDGPKNQLTEYGQIVAGRLKLMADFYPDIKLEKYVVMPNHVHLLLHITGTMRTQASIDAVNSKISKFVGTFKRLCNRECGINLWQSRSHDHVIRGEQDYLKIWQYIEENPLRWALDCFYTE